MTELSASFWQRVHKTDHCWLWTGSMSRDGYGHAPTGGSAHRLMFEAEVRPLSPDEHVDHKCHNDDAVCVGSKHCPHRRCVRPDHLQARPANENRADQYGARKPACVRGHAFTPDNTYTGTGHRRQCRKCQAAAVQRYKARKMLRKKAS